jgi:hypothetical protein
MDRLIYEIREQKVMLDADLAEVYGVETRVLVQAVKRNSRRFPADFIFQLSEPEWDPLRSQIVISKGKGGRRYRPYVFTRAWGGFHACPSKPEERSRVKESKARYRTR